MDAHDFTGLKSKELHCKNIIIISYSVEEMNYQRLFNEVVKEFDEAVTEKRQV